ncbi:Oxysterol-binding protein-related protein 6 [Orchesella cincta]|uniref:Oxysterol-binding protein-related protein 6 n=1 Tax=Orchesella cincta TaxID=48709 RepID=A0A1D2NI21_ORCCI|nr:Oxysterol-binding protein-related protein 6 [Orchesella cincta]
MKNCIGKDLTKIPMPVNFSEPLSMLQRLTEDFEYSEILDQAAMCSDSCEQLSYVAAFHVSFLCYNGLLIDLNCFMQHYFWGETYECDRMDDMGWRCINEQVSHHPSTGCLNFARDASGSVTGCVMNNAEVVRYVLNGTWDTKIDGCAVLKIKETDTKGKPVFELGPSKTLWTRRQLTEEQERYYCFTEFACQLNESEAGVAPSDSRMRPDQRLMEEAKWDEANTEKVRLEEKQRANRRRREVEAEQAATEGARDLPTDGSTCKEERSEK